MGADIKKIGGIVYPSDISILTDTRMPVIQVYENHFGVEKSLYIKSYTSPIACIYNNGVLDKPSDDTPRYEGSYNQVQTFICQTIMSQSNHI